MGRVVNPGIDPVFEKFKFIDDQDEVGTIDNLLEFFSDMVAEIELGLDGVSTKINNLKKRLNNGR